jgi:hypothetical protein
LFLLCRGSNNPRLKNHYRKYCRVLSEVIKAATRLHYNKIITSSNKVKTTWHIVKTETNKHPSNHNMPPLHMHGNLCNDYQAISNEFNKYFYTVADNILNNNFKSCNKMTNVSQSLNYLHHTTKHPFSHMTLSPTSTNEISKIIRSLKNKNSYGYDEIPIKILKVSIPFIKYLLAYIINKSLTNGIFPACLKYSQMNPTFKSGDKSDMSNYRPISLLTSFSKIFEKVICKRFYEHIISNNILSSEQYGLRRNSSTEIATYSFLNNVLLALNKSIVGDIFCDLLKAFDCVNHDILIPKLEFYSISGRAKQPITSYLQNRYQRVMIKKKAL